MTSKTALVTGAFGFIGRHVAKHLAQDGWSVIGVGHGSWTLTDWQRWGISHWHAVDLTSEALITYAQQPDLIVHCAGSNSVGFSMKNPLQDFRRTVETTAIVLEFARTNAPTARVVLCSSAGVYGHTPRLPIKETAELRPASHYGIGKLSAEQLCQSYAKHFGIGIAVVRLFSVYGTGLRRLLLWDACVKFGANAPEFAGTGDEVRDWLHVNDAARLLICAGARASKSCPTVNGGAGRAVTVRQAVETIGRHFPNAPSPQFNGLGRVGDPPHYLADISAAKAWDWFPHIKFEDGVAEYVSWFTSGDA
jgi:UDP-glucose 4-epimerase